MKKQYYFQSLAVGFLFLTAACQSSTQESKNTQISINELTPNLKEVSNPQDANLNGKGHIAYAQSLEILFMQDGGKVTGSVLLDGKKLNVSGTVQDKVFDVALEDEQKKVVGKLNLRHESPFALIGEYKTDDKTPIQIARVFLDQTSPQQKYTFTNPIEKLADASPDDLLTKAKAAKTTSELVVLLAQNNLISASPADFKIMTNGTEDTLSVNPQKLSMKVDYQNLFGSSEKEAIVEVSYANSIHFLSFFYKEKDTWKQVDGMLSFNRKDASATPCAVNDEKYKKYFSYQYVPIRSEEENCIVGSIAQGRCGDGTERGNDINFGVWQVTPKGVFQIFSAKENDYWYNSPSPAPIKTAIKTSFGFGSDFPKDIIIKDIQITPIYKDAKQSPESFVENKEKEAKHIELDLKFVE